MLRAARIAVGAALPVAITAALSISHAPAQSDAPGATSFGNAVLPPLPELPNTVATPKTEWVPLALSGAATAAQPARAPASAAGIPESGAGGSEADGEAAAPAKQLAASRREAIDAARRTQEAERAVAAIRHEIDLLRSDADASWRDLAESRDEQARLLGAILHLAHSPARPADGDASPVERLRAAALMREVDPALRARLLALTAEITRLDALRKRIDAETAEEAAARQALAGARERLAGAVARRNALLSAMAPPQGIDAALRIADAEREAKTVADLINRVEAAAESSGKQPQRSRTGGARRKPAPLLPADDPTRPDDLRSLAQEPGLGEAEPAPSAGPRPVAEQGAAPSQPLLVPPVAGTIVHPGGEPGAPAAPNDGLSLKGAPGATVVAPFDGKIVYAGPFRDLGRVLIIRHDRRYYSALVGLGRVDAKLGDWVLAGEPVGAMPDTPTLRSGAQARELDEIDPGGLLYYELRRDGSPVDPQPWLASVGDGPDERNGERKVNQ